jgi:hypothetical protein
MVLPEMIVDLVQDHLPVHQMSQRKIVRAGENLEEIR